MSMTMLREYLITLLPAPVDENRLTAFFEQTDVKESMAKIGQITEGLVFKWNQQLPDSAAKDSAVVEQTSVIVPAPAETLSEAKAERTYSFLGGTVTGPGQQKPNNAEPTHSFLVPEEKLKTSLQPTLPAINTNPGSDIPEATANSELTTDPVRFTSTNRPETPAPQPLRSISIPNATVGKPYTYTFDFVLLGMPELTEHTLRVSAATGLIYDRDTRTLSGILIEAGEVSFELTYRIKTDEPERPSLTRRVQLLVNPDPRSLWRDLPSDTSDPYYKPDSDKELLAIGDIRLLAASVRGRSHAHEGKFRDDDFSLAHFPEAGWYSLTVADGAGSARYSRKGAQLACHTVAQYLQNNVEPQNWNNLDAVINKYVPDQQESSAGAVQRQLYDLLGKAVFEAYQTIKFEAGVKAAELKDYATTLISVLVRQVAGGWFVGAFWVGDGGVGIYHADKEPVVLGTPDGGEYAGQTRFLTMSETIANNFFSRFRFAFVENFDAVILMTDGITDPKFQTDSNLNRKVKWDELWADLNKDVSLSNDEQIPDQLLNWLTFWSPGNHDDRTIAMLYTHADNEKN